MICIFIGGASGSGKTSLTQHIFNKLKAEGFDAQKINMDDYYHEIPEGVDLDEFRNNTNFDTPTAMDLELFRKDLYELNEGNSITKPKFNFKVNLRDGEETIRPSEVIIIEGIFAQYFSKNFLPAEWNTLTVNIATESYGDIVERRIKRDTNPHTRGRTRAESVQQERKYVGPGFLKYTASSSIGADLYVVNSPKYTQKDQYDAFEAVSIEVVDKLRQKQVAFCAKKELPDTQELIAKSHLIAGTLFNPRKFSGYFGGVFGSYKGLYEREFSDSEVAGFKN